MTKPSMGPMGPRVDARDQRRTGSGPWPAGGSEWIWSAPAARLNRARAKRGLAIPPPPQPMSSRRPAPFVQTAETGIISCALDNYEGTALARWADAVRGIAAKALLAGALAAGLTPAVMAAAAEDFLAGHSKDCAGCDLTAAANFVTNDVAKAQAQLTGPWQIAVVPTENYKAWRINTATGKMERCLAVSTAVCQRVPGP